MSEPLRVGNCSGFYGDRLAAMREMLEGGELDVLTGDYLAELTMLILARDRAKDPSAGYARTFLVQLRDCLALALDRKVRIVANAGGVNTPGLVAAIRALHAKATIAYVRGDALDPGRHAYLGAFGIARALSEGADIVVTGRVTDASLVIGPAIARFGWGRDDRDALAGATVAGHVLECGTQATGGNYPFFTEIPGLDRAGFPIAEIHSDGSAVITKHPGTGGAVTIGTVTAQLMYEVGGIRYAGPDVTTRLDTVRLDQIGPDRVAVTGVRGEPPPPELKVSATSAGGYRNSVTVVLTGLDIPAKAALFERQFRAGLAVEPEELTFSVARVDAPDAPTQQQASALLTVVGRDPDEKKVGRAFSNAAVEVALGSYPGFFGVAPPGRAVPYGVFRAEYVPQYAYEVVHDDGTVEEIAAPVRVRELPPEPERPPTAGPDDTDTVRMPLGTIIGARSGDKGGDATIGLWARTQAAHAWLDHLITEPTIRRLLPETETASLPIRITRFPNLRAVNIVIEGLLGLGVAYGNRFDPQAKGLAEWLRSRHVDIPASLLEEPS